MANLTPRSLTYRLSDSESGSEDGLLDAEKRSSSTFSESTISFSDSSVHSDGHTLPMAYSPIKRTSSYRSRIRQSILQHCCVCTPRRFSRYFSLIIITSIIFLILTLTHLSSSSTRNIRAGLRKPKPTPPAWESFPFLTRYHGGIRKLVSFSENIPEYPRSHGQSEGTLAQKTSKDEPDHKNQEQSIPPSIAFDVYPSDSGIVQCFLDAEKKTKVPDVRAYHGVPSGMPHNVIGSYDVLGVRKDVCFERFGRLAPYGLGYSKRVGGSGAGIHGDREGIENIWTETPKVDYRNVKWGDAQSACIESNKHRFANMSSSPIEDETLRAGNVTKLLRRTVSNFIPRNAVIIRTWNDYEYKDEDLFNLRALVWELSMKTGGEYTVHFLIHVRDNSLPIWADEDTYNRVLKESLPAEFKGMGTLWSEGQMSMIYNHLPENQFRDLPLHGVYRSHHMALVWFAQNHPEFEYFWQFEMDIRYAGQYYHLLSNAANWASKQPRKGLWERNSRFYVPSEHGSWEDFSHMARVQTEHGTAGKSSVFAGLVNNPAVPESVKEEISGKAEKAVWGPEPPPFDTLESSSDKLPPHNMIQDKAEWGVDEPADLMTFNPIFDPHGTHWVLAEDVTGYNKTAGLPPRRAAISTFGRYSKSLLRQMHREMALSGKHMSSEMFPATVALHHGLKAVYVPHPVFIDRFWPTDFLASTFNGGRNGQSGGSRLSVFSEEREHNFLGTTWYYNAGFGPNLWRRWLGYKVDNDGGEVYETAGEGRMCLPAMLFHPIKDVSLFYERDGG